jgi:arginyl-tRNA synthetase
MNLFTHFQTLIIAELQALAADGTLPQGLDLSRVTVEPPREAQHGDLATNAAMVLAKAAGMPPRTLAEKLLPRLRAHPDITDGAIAGPGFLNLRLANRVWQDQLRQILAAGTGWGDSQIGAGVRVNVEYVSANPTGPLHVGHARGAVFGDVLASLLAKTGHAVTREYYINDAGAQVNVLARSAYLRYREALGEDIGAIPETRWRGDGRKRRPALAGCPGGHVAASVPPPRDCRDARPHPRGSGSAWHSA